MIRNGRRTDIDLLGDIERAAARLFPPERIPDPEDSHPLESLERAADGGLLFVVEVEDAVAGFATCTLLDRRLHLDELAVHPDHGRRGLGRALVQKVIETACGRSLEGVSLTTFSDIPWNGPFYASMGFEDVPEAALDDALNSVLKKERELGFTKRVAMFRSTAKETQ